MMDRLYEWENVLPEMQLDPGVMMSLDDVGVGGGWARILVSGMCSLSGPPWRARQDLMLRRDVTGVVF